MKFLTQAAKVRNEQKKDKRRLAVFLCLAVIVALGTAAALKMYGQAMSHKDKRLICQVEAHQHTDQCYDGDKVICGYADYIVHTHNDDCYDGDGNLVCHLQEAPAHVHTDECYTEEKVLVCEEEEQAHQHTESCYTPEKGELQCQLEEHTHGEECYDSETGELICQVEEHKHDDNCYVWEEVLTCPYAAQSHQHSDECYTREKGDLQCQIEEHTHAAECYNENNELICEKEEHTHNDDCYAWNDVLTCQLEETPAGHTHTDACYETKKVLTCGQLELHTHDENCLDENGVLVCGLLELKEHTHQAECFETVELTDEEVAAKLEAEEAEIAEQDPVSVSEDGVEMVPAIIKTFENEKYVVTAAYHEDANIPEEAELTAEIITPENGGDHYAEREAELRKTLGDESVSMNALLKIGFYVDGEEIEPESDVTVTVQFLDEDGLAEGSPIAVVHFAEEGSQVLDGGNVKDQSATFKTNGFSEFGYAEGVDVQKEQLEEEQPESEKSDVSENKKPETKKTETKTNETEQSSSDEVSVSQTYNYRDEAYHISFFIEGKAKPLDSKNDAPKIISFGDEDTIIDAEEAQSADDVTSEEDDITTSENDNNVASENKVEEDKDADVEQKTRSVTSELDEEEETEDAGDTEEGEDTGEAEESTSGSSSENDTEDTDSAVEEDGEDGTEDAVEEDGAEENVDPAEKEELDFNVKLLDEKSEKYQAINTYTKDIDIADALSNMRAFEFSLKNGGEELNLDECVVTAHIEATEKLLKAQSGIELSVLDVTDEGEVSELDSAALNPENKTMTVALNNNSAGLYSTVNTMFRVQYYANLKTVKTSTSKATADGTNSVQIIDTSAAANGGTATLPVNGTDPKTTYLYLEGRTGSGEIGQIHDVMYEEKLHEIYAEETYDLSTYPEIKNFNKFATDKAHYKLEWVQEKTGPGENDWKNYDPATVRITNNSEEEAKDKDHVILIKDDSVIRLVAKTTEDSYTNGVSFYDYDISDGKVYSSVDCNSEIARNSKDVQYAKVGKEGINNESNYGNYTKPRYGFGNITGGGIETNTDDNDGYFMNRSSAHADSPKKAFEGCSFGLVQRENGLNDEELPIFTVNAPDLFSANDQNAKEESKKVIGKTTYGDYSLNFDRDGDTYTLMSVQKGGGDLNTAKNLHQFQAMPNWNNTRYVWSNSFWPMDDAATFGAEGHDFKFGGSATANGKRKTSGINKESVNFNISDTKKGNTPIDHNAYFGMSFSVTFDLTGLEDYRGPLNYYFFGDDDMWVYLDGKKLICDLGGVHSSSGEYVNLWDYLGEKKTVNGKEVITLKADEAKKHTLHFFYTERGASGSCCWMQFTLPSVASGPVNQPTGDSKTTLTVGKTVAGEIADPDASYEFVMTLTGKDGKPLTNYYNFEILDKDGNLVPDGKGSIKNGDSFELKHQQSIVVRNLPDGAHYTVKEKPYSGYVANINNEITADGMASGEIDWEADEGEELDYINQPVTYELPKTGGPGPIIYTIAGAVCIIFGAGFMYKKRIKERRR